MTPRRGGAGASVALAMDGGCNVDGDSDVSSAATDAEINEARDCN
ncbi:MAG TPA: hypothetical protein VK425_08575 [Acidimicrobiales bacterium]|nr:hypothetical protein [Acidimicrobiales bacterium]